MGEFFFLFLFVLFAVAVAVKEDFVFLLLYLFAGAFILGRWWGRRVLQGVQVERSFPERAFLGERVRVDLHIKNTGWLPAPWLQVRESLPVELRTGEMSGPAFQHVASLGPYGLLQLAYPLDCRKRGYYAIGPLDLYAGDVLGVAQVQHSRQAAQHLTIYPRIISLTHVKLPSQAPLGTLRHTQPVFEDPSRVMGKRDYVAGDSLRRVDWKATATTGRMQIKLFEPSIALETAIFLNLNAAEYDARSRYDVTELEIVVAASLANWVIGARQAAGLYANGVDMAGGAGTSGAGTGGGGPTPAPKAGGGVGGGGPPRGAPGGGARGGGAPGRPRRPLGAPRGGGGLGLGGGLGGGARPGGAPGGGGGHKAGPYGGWDDWDRHPYSSNGGCGGEGGRRPYSGNPATARAEPSAAHFGGAGALAGCRDFLLRRSAEPGAPGAFVGRHADPGDQQRR